MSKPLCILIIEDSEDDAVLLLRELRRGGHEPVFERVETAESMKSALQQKQWDIVISDYVLPQFSGPAALKILRESGIDLPFIIVSGNIGEDIAVEAMKSGAHDYILKGNLKRLIPAVERELRDAELRRESCRLKEIKKEKEFIDAVLNNIEMLVIVLDQTGKILSFNRAFEILTSYSFFEVKDRPFWDIFLTADEVETIKTLFSELRAGMAPNRHKNYWLTKSGSRRFIEWTYSVIKDVEGSVKYIIGTGIDATNRKQAEEALWQATEELQRSHKELEERVRVRTSELSGLNDDLEAEIYERREAEKRLARMNALYSILFRVNEAIVRIHKPEMLFEQTCRIVVDSGLFKMAWIGSVDPDTAKVKSIASAGDNGRYLDNVTIIARDVPEGRGPTGRAIREGKAQICLDIENDPSMLPCRESALTEGFRSSAAIPLRDDFGVVGSLTVFADSPYFFADTEVRLLCSLAEDISFAIETMAGENKRKEMEEDLKTSRDELRALSAHLQTMREEERIKIAREIHDELGQILTAAGLELSLIRNRYQDQAPIHKAVSAVIELLDYAVTDIQRICEKLRPRILDHLGLPVAIKQEVAAFTKRTGIHCSLDLVSKIPGLTDESTIALFRVVQEALTNVARHSGATRLMVRLAADRRDVILEVTDNGKGISPQELGNNSSLGLIGMRERIRDVGGEVTFSGAAGKGTTITVKIPGEKNNLKRGTHV